MTDPADRRDPPALAFEESAEDLYENAPCGYVSSLPGGLLVKVNQTFLNWTGYRREDLIGRRRFQDLLTAGGRIFHETHYAPLLRMQGEVREIAFEISCADGRRLPVIVSSAFRTDESGTPILIRTTVANATDRKEYERELVREREKAERADKAKADFISMISHEIRTPLNAIMGVAHLLGTTGLSPQQEKLVRILRSSSENLLHLVNEILDFSKIESGKVTLEERAVDLRKLIHEVVFAFHAKAEEKGVVLEARVDDRLPCVLLADPVKIGQVLTNLLGNAIKFTAKGSVFLELQVVELEAEAASVEIRVADTGIGIAPDRLAHIFEDFTQASYDIGMKYGGTGLGLSISKRLVEMHGSRLEVESELGRGTSFSFRLRMKTGEPGAEESGAEETAGPQTLRGLKVLVADDNEVNVFVLTGLLRRWCVEYDVVADGRQAVESVKARDYDLVLMDLRMPELDGYAATRQIRSLPDPKFARLPIFAISASTRMGHQHDLDAAGFTEFIGKPINPDILFRKLALHAR
ncbi:MAG: ATP-binding protein [Thermoanaerobaculia bacterium]